MDIFLIRLLQFMLAIGLLVLLHEGGHFFFSKLFGVRVDKRGSSVRNLPGNVC